MKSKNKHAPCFKGKNIDTYEDTDFVNLKNSHFERKASQFCPNMSHLTFLIPVCSH